MRLRTKVFLGLFILSGLMTLTSGYVFYFYQSKAIKEDFLRNHNSIANMISNNLRQAENLTDQMMLNTAFALEDTVNKKFPSKIELQKLRDKFKVTDFYIISNTGKFLESTDDFAETTDFNFFSFCSDYKNLVDEPFLIDQTPILLAHPPNNDKPYKFTHLTSRDKKYIIEVGIHLEYIQNILSSSISSYQSINRIKLKTPSDQILGEIKTKNQNGEFITIKRDVDSNDSQCCQCKTKKLTNGKYFYKLEFEVSTSEMTAALNRIFKTITILEIFLIFISFIFSRFLTRYILTKFEKLSSAIDTIATSGELNFTPPKIQDKDLESISQSFNRMLKNLNDKEIRLIEVEKEKTHFNLSNQVAHDIRSPLEMLKSIKDDLALLPIASRRRIQLGINRIEEITFNLLKTNKLEFSSREEPQREELLGLLLSVINEKKIEFRNIEKIEIVESFSPDSHGLFSKINRTVFKNIISNLINNSFDAIGSNNGTIIVSLEEDKNNNLIKIQDTGEGIPGNIANLIFTKGFTTKNNGNGLGLHNAKRDIESYGGSIIFESERARGTTFIISLPKSEIPAIFLDAIHAYKYDRIIILDDDPAFHDVLSKRLEGVENKIEHIYSVEEMFKKYQALHPKILLLSDFELMDKDSDGIDVIHKLNHAKDSVLVTARSEEVEIQERCLEAGIKLLPKSLVNYVKVYKDTSSLDFSSSLTDAEIRDGGDVQAKTRTIDTQDTQKQKTLIVLIDDDKLVHYSWSYYCENKGFRFKGFFSIDKFLQLSHLIDKESRIYIDSNLGDGIKGEIESEKIFKIGFKNLYLATGYGKEYIKKPEWIIEIYSKSPEIMDIN